MAASADAPLDVPVIDLAAFDEPAAWPKGVRAIDAACRETGFFIVVGHGIEAEVSEVFGAAHAFFDQTQEHKELTPRIDRYGYVPSRRLALDVDRQSGTTEFVEFGRQGEVPWPELDGFEAAIVAYQAAALKVAEKLLAAVAEALRVDQGFFRRHMSDPQCRLRLLHYFEGRPDGAGQLPVPTPAHTDYGAITLLATDGVPGLQVKPLGGNWQAVDAPSQSLVVNLGDMLARWTNDEYRSTPHRVIGPVGQDRFSIPFFVNPDPMTTIECIPTCVSTDRPCNYEPVTAHEFLAMRIDGREEPYIERES